MAEVINMELQTILFVALIILIVVIKSPQSKNKKTNKESQIKTKTKAKTYSDETIETYAETYYDDEIESTLININQEIEQLNYIKTAYTSRWMFTTNEKRAYYKLRKIADQYELILFAKVRLFDLVTPQRYHPKYKTNLYKIQAKHVDFVLTGKNLVAKYIIELDDSSHDTLERKKRDKFVDTVLLTCGYKVFRTREIIETEIEQFIKAS